MASPEYDYRNLLGGGHGASLLNGGFLTATPVRHKVFVSYHHGGDQAYYDAFSTTFHDGYDAIYDNSLERKVDSDNALYVMQRIRDTCITGTSCTIVLVGANTYKRKYVDWEIYATLDKGHGLIGVRLPSAPIVQGFVIVPDRLNDNIQSGYASWLTWAELTASASALQQHVSAAKSRSALSLTNTRARMTRNSA